MDYFEKNLSHFTVLYSENLNDKNQATFSSSSSASSNSSFIDNAVQVVNENKLNIQKASVESRLSESVLKGPKSVEERKKQITKKKEEKLIRKYQMEEAAKLQVIARSKCGRFVKYDYKIGEGGYKIVSKGFDKENCCDIAWCEVKREHFDSKEKNQGMLKEIEIMLKLDHPNVVKCYAVLKDWWLIRDDSNDKRGESKGLVIIQELMGAGTLKEMIKKNFHDGRCILDIRLITRWLYQILDVLRYMHCRIQPPIIHRDVKSDNCFLVEQAGEEFVSVKIGDFGLATTINHNSQRKTMIGTVGFMAPEVYEESYDIKVDIYAFGMMVLEVMTNKTPYDDCTNVFQVISKSMGSNLPDVISTITQPLIKEIISVCVHPVPTFRPSAEELCEHVIFQNCPLIVEPVLSDGCTRSDAISTVVQQVSSKNGIPIIDLMVSVNNDFVQQNACQIEFNSVTFSLDVYQSQNSDLSELIAVLNDHINNEFKTSNTKLNRAKKLSESVRLQIQYLIKLINGERWRKIFNDFLLKESEERRNHRSNSTPTQRNFPLQIDCLIPSNSLNSNNVDKYTNNFTEYSNNVATYHKAKESFDNEIESYCCEARVQRKPYFSNIISKKIQFTSVDEPMILNVTNALKLMVDTNRVSGRELSKVDSGIMTSPVSETISINDDVFMSPNIKHNKDVITRFVRAEVYSSADSANEDEVTQPFYDNPVRPVYPNQESYIGGFNPVAVSIPRGMWPEPYAGFVTDQHQNSKMNLIQNYRNFESDPLVGYDFYHFMQSYEPPDAYVTNSNMQLDQILPIRNNLQAGSKSALSESCYRQAIYNGDQSSNATFVHNYNPHLFYETVYPQQQSQQPINNATARSITGQPKVLCPVPKPLLSQNINSVYSGPYYNHTKFLNPESQVMQSNSPYIVPPDQSSRNPISMSQPILTRSLPSIVGSVPASVDNVIVSGFYQSYVSSASSATVSQAIVSITAASRNDSSNVPLKQMTFQNCSQNQLLSQRFNLPIISTAKPISVRPQSNYSTIIPSTKVLEKSKKKSKSRLKSKYLLKVINIQENLDPNETILTFEMMLPMHQMRFTCCLSNEFNSLDVSNSVEESDQITGELGKKDILESLVNTVKKICHCLTEDIHSIPLNEDFVFHPCSQNSGLIRLSDSNFSIPVSLDNELSQLNYSLQSTLSLQPFTIFNNSCTSSRSLSRHPSIEDVSQSMGTSMTDYLPTSLADTDLIIFNETNVVKPTVVSALSKSVSEPDSNIHTIVPSKCTCPMNELSIKVPEYLFGTLKQMVDKLLSLHCKGLILLPNSHDILTRTFRVLEIPADHMFVGLPCSDSSYNVIKGQKDKDFIIAKDKRDPDNVIDKCVYQKPSDGAVLLDSSGEIQYIQKPSIILPPKPGFGNEKTVVKELPSELTHRNDQILDLDQIISVLQSLTQIQGCSNQGKDELFDSPVLLEPTKLEFPKKQSDKTEVLENYPVRGPDDVIISQAQPQSQIQVEKLFCQYVTLPQTSDGRPEDLAYVADSLDRDLPRQQVRSRKISNESLDSISATRSRPLPTVPFVNEAEHLQTQSSFQKSMVNNLMNIQNPQKSLQIAPIINQMPMQRPGSTSGQFMLANQNSSSSMPGNIFHQNIQNVPLYSNSTPGSGPNANFSHVLPNQMVISSGMTQTQMSKFTHQLQQQNQKAQRIAVPSSMSSASLSSSQMFPNIQSIQQNVIPVSQAIHHSQMLPQFSDQYSSLSSSSHATGDILDSALSNIARQIPLTNVRQLPSSVGAQSSQYFDQNVINSIMADNIRIQMMNQSIAPNAQSQTAPVLFIPHHPLVSSSSLSSNNPVPVVSVKTNVPAELPNQNIPDFDTKPKSEQTIGRFVVRPVTESTEN